MLTITMNPAHQIDGRPYARTMSFAMTLADLFRTVRVVGERIVFLEPRPGLLLNLAHVERIEEDIELAMNVERIQREAVGFEPEPAAAPMSNAQELR